MDKLLESDIRLLKTFSCALRGKESDWIAMPERNVWKSIYRSAEEHKIFPMIMESVSKNSFFAENQAIQDNYLFYLKRSEAEILTQSRRTAEFMLLYDFLLNKGLKPLVMKGIVCRSLYPEPEHRSSSDEDILIDPDDFMEYHNALLEYGMELVNSKEDIRKAYEVAYQDKEKLLYIEIHKHLFPPESKVFAEWNVYFDSKDRDCFPVHIYGDRIYTIDPTLHLVYLILHALKHFLHGGFGIRQIADIVLFSWVYSPQINWELTERIISEVQAKDFVRAIYKIAAYYLWEDYPKEILFPGWDFSEIDEKPLLADVMDGGVYGASSLARLHSSNMTLEAVSARRQGRRGRSVLRSLFPGKKYLQSHYPYAKKYPVLLPMAWGQRIVSYLRKEGSDRSNPGKSLQIGRERIGLLKKYGII